MHHRLYVLFDKEDAKDSEEARHHVYDELDSDPSFCGDGGRFCSPVSDWFVIGGRWSGALTELSLNKEKMDLFWKDFESQQLGWTSSEHSEEEQGEKARKLFSSYFPKFTGMFPVYRNHYEHYGFEDDAMIVTKKLWKDIKSQLSIEGTPSYDDVESGIIELDSNDLDDKSVIGKKWIVVVDYHS